MQIFDTQFLTFIIKMSLAMILGLFLGLERIYAHKTVGLRTYALASVATCFFVTLSLYVGTNLSHLGDGFNPAFIVGSVITGIGFLGAGLIFFKDDHMQNLTTAAGLWVCAGIGMAVGFGMYREAIFVTILTFFVLGILSSVERYIRLTFFPDPAFENEVKEIKKRKPRVKK